MKIEKEKCQVQKSKNKIEKYDDNVDINCVDLRSSNKVIKRNEEVNTSLIFSNALLIVAPRGEVEAWARIIRELTLPRLCVYTDTLAKRRKIGANSLSQYDVVITTFDVRKCVAEYSVM